MFFLLPVSCFCIFKLNMSNALKRKTSEAKSRNNDLLAGRIDSTWYFFVFPHLYFENKYRNTEMMMYLQGDRTAEGKFKGR